MDLNFENIVAAAYSCVLLMASLLYVLVVQPLSRALPGSLREPVRAYFARLLMLCAGPLVERAVDIQYTGDQIRPHECALVLLNHQTIVDYIIVNTLAKRNGVNKNCFYFTEKQVVRFPTLRTVISRLNGNGNWAVAPKTLDKVFSPMYAVSKTQPSWLVVFPEVAPFSAQESRSQQVFCYLSGAKPMKHVLYPRFQSSLQAIEYLRESGVTAVYDLTLLYSHGEPERHAVVPNVRSVIMSDKTWQVTVNAKRFNMPSLPRSHKGLEKWLEKRWYRKDSQLTKDLERLSKSYSLPYNKP